MIVRLARRVTGALTRRQEFQRWRRARQTEGSYIHPAIEFTGSLPPYDRVEFGPGSIVERDVTIWLASEEGGQPRVTVGEHAFIGRNTYIGSWQPITIGAHCLIGAYSYIISANHVYERRDIPIQQQGFTGAPITLERDVWLGTHVVVLPGVTIGQGAIVAAGSIVTKNIPPYEIWGGAPAKFLKTRPE